MVNKNAIDSGQSLRLWILGDQNNNINSGPNWIWQGCICRCGIQGKNEALVVLDGVFADNSLCQRKLIFSLASAVLDEEQN